MIAQTRGRTSPPSAASPSPLFAGRVRVLAVRRDTREKNPYVVTLRVVASTSDAVREIAVKLEAAEVLDFDRLRLRLATHYGLLLHPATGTAGTTWSIRRWSEGYGLPLRRPAGDGLRDERTDERTHAARSTLGS